MTFSYSCIVHWILIETTAEGCVTFRVKVYLLYICPFSNWSSEVTSSCTTTLASGEIQTPGGQNASADPRLLPTLPSPPSSHLTADSASSSLSLPLSVRSTVDWPAVFIVRVEVILFVCGPAGCKFSGGKGLLIPLAHHVFLSLSSP